MKYRDLLAYSDGTPYNTILNCLLEEDSTAASSQLRRWLLNAGCMALRSEFGLPCLRRGFGNYQ